MSASLKQIDRLRLRAVDIPLKEPFRTPHGTVRSRAVVIIEVCGGGISGYGEAATLPLPDYSVETQASALTALQNVLVAKLLTDSPDTPNELAARLKLHRRDPLARAGLEMACWDWWAKAQSRPLYQVLGGRRDEIPVGVAVPLVEDRGALFETIGRYLEAGYQRIKIKLLPGLEKRCREIVDRFGSIPLMVDANGSYSRENAADLKGLDELGLLMIEQPLAANDLAGHAALQRELQTPLCLDESIVDKAAAEDALRLEACRIINVKAGRVGGPSEAMQIHDLAAHRGCGVWCGGLLETGIGRAHNIALATLPNFRYPGDISASGRYFERDIITPAVTLSPGGTIKLSPRPGIGYDIDRAELARWTSTSLEIGR